MKTEFIVGQNADLTDKTVKGTLYGRKLHLLRCETPDAGPIAVIDLRRDTSGWHEILAVGERCIHFGPEDVGKLVWIPVSPIGKKTWCWRVGPNERIAREEWFESTDGPPLMVVDMEDVA